MDFIDHLRVLANRIANMKDLIQTEEATRNAMAFGPDTILTTANELKYTRLIQIRGRARR